MLMKQHSYCATNIELFRKKEQVDAIQSKSRKSKDDKEQLAQLETELHRSTVSFPNNITIWNYIDFLLIPTFVYELEYPRTPRFRPFYFFSKVLGFAVGFVLIYITLEHYIHPVMNDLHNETFLESIIQLMLPYTVIYLIMFFMLFECLCNAFAELTL
jgi:sterol O-acyltransferase